MPVITSIKQQKNRNRVNVYLDDEFGFGIDLDNFVLLHLKVNQELTEGEVEEIVKKAKVRSSKIYYLRDKTAKEIRKKVRLEQVKATTKANEAETEETKEE